MSFLWSILKSALQLVVMVLVLYVLTAVFWNQSRTVRLIMIAAVWGGALVMMALRRSRRRRAAQQRVWTSPPPAPSAGGWSSGRDDGPREGPSGPQENIGYEYRSILDPLGIFSKSRDDDEDDD